MHSFGDICWAVACYASETFGSWSPAYATQIALPAESKPLVCRSFDYESHHSQVVM
ncbi:hypothetical protein DAI22_03g076700 [Oryza sativa Japonica Group]|nr:hypothetical protein DAI22_03g076700 [Oryza sativa Japonica Group]